MNKNIFILVLILSISIALKAQEKKVIQNNPNYKFQSEKQNTNQSTAVRRSTPAFQQYWSFGGNLGLAFWNGGSDVLIAPKGYFHVSPQFITGVGVTYIYSDGEFWVNNIGGSSGYVNYHSNSFGGSISGIYRPIPSLQLSVEYEGLQTEWRGIEENSYWNNAIYLGASFVSGPVSFGFRYDVIYDSSRSVYGSALTPIIGIIF